MPAEQSSRAIEAIIAGLENNQIDAVRAVVATLHPSDLADVFAQLDAAQRYKLAEDLRPEDLAEVLSWLDAALREELIEKLDLKKIAAAVEELDSDDAVDVISELDAADQQELLAAIAPEDRALLQESLTYPEDSAGRLMQREVVALPEHWDIGHTIDFLRNHEELPSTFYEVFVVDSKHKLLGHIPLSQLLQTRRPVVLSSIMQPANRIINTHTSLDDVTYQFRHYALVSLPVVNAAGQLAGVITVDDVVEVIEEQAEENTMRLGGLSSLDFYRASWITARNRFTWLFVNLLTAVLASWVISFFTKSIEQVVALAVLMPIVASMGGNAGTQTVTVTVRALALRQLKANNRMRFITKESVVGLMNGGLFALLAAVFCGVWFDNFKLGLVMGTAMIINLFMAGFSGTLIPLGLKRLGFDPAVSTTVFLTTVTDVVGYVAFLGLATWVLL